MTVGIYIRVSTQEQAQEGYSIPAQKERLTAYCKAQGWNDYKFYIDDGRSGRDMERPKLKLLLDHVKQGKIKLLLVYRLDRFTRSVKDLHKMLELLNEYGCGFKSATEVYDTTTAMGRLFITIVAALAEWETDNMSERISMALEEKVSSGEHVGGIPYSFDRTEDEKLVANPERSAVTLKMIEKIEAGWSVRQVANYLTKVDNKEWYTNTIIRILRNPVLYGSTRWNDKVYENTHEGIISKDRFVKLQQILDDRSLHPRRDVKSIYLFQGTIVCPDCNHTLSVNRFIHKNKDGSEHVGAVYRCLKCIKAGKKAKYIGERRFLNGLYEYMKNVTFDDIELPEVDDDREKLTVQLKQIEKKREKYQRAWASDLISDKEFEKLMNETKEVYEDLKKEISEHEAPATLDIDELKKIVMTFNQNFKLLSQEEKRTFISSFIRRIEYKLIPQPPKNKRNKVGKDLVVITHVEFY